MCGLSSVTGCEFGYDGIGYDGMCLCLLESGRPKALLALIDANTSEGGTMISFSEHLGGLDMEAGVAVERPMLPSSAANGSLTNYAAVDIAHLPRTGLARCLLPRPIDAVEAEEDCVLCGASPTSPSTWVAGSWYSFIMWKVFQGVL